MYVKRFFQPLLLGLLPMHLALTVQAEEVKPQDPVALMQSAIDALKDTKSFQFTSEYSYEVTQPDSQKLEFSSIRQVTVQRPNQMSISFQRRSGEAGNIYIDGKNITLTSDTHKVFAQTSQPGDTKQTIKFMAERLDLPLPLSDFFMPKPEESILSSLTSSAYISSDIINDQPAHNLAFRNDQVDFQAWISDEEAPKLLRVIITYKQHKGLPSFRANLTDWVFNPRLGPATFTPNINKEYEKIPMLVLDPPSEPKAAEGAAQ